MLNKRVIEDVCMAQIVEGLTNKHRAGVNTENTYLAIQPHLKFIRSLFPNDELSDIADFGSTVCYPFGLILGEMLEHKDIHFSNLTNPYTMRGIICKLASVYFDFDDGHHDNDIIMEIVNKYISG